MSASEVSTKAGCSVNYLSSILDLGQSPSIDKFMSIADVLNVGCRGYLDRLAASRYYKTQRFLRINPAVQLIYYRVILQSRNLLLNLSDPLRLLINRQLSSVMLATELSG